VPNDLTQHNCIAIRQGNEAYGIWHLSSGQRSETVKVRGNLSSNDGEVALNWALAGHGLVMRAEWDIAKYLDNGRLRQVLEAWQTPPADIHAVYPQSLQTAARVRAFVDYLVAAFATAAPRQLKLSRGPGK
jgi:DNA-binding transcriptional LysR family regulator